MNEQIKIWFNALMNHEIKLVEKDIENEKVWSLSDPDNITEHDETLKNLYEYKSFLESRKLLDINEAKVKE